MKYKLSAALLGVVCCHSYATEWPEMVVSTTRVSQPLNASLSSVTVITAEEIQHSEAADVASLLRSVPGTAVAQNGGMGKVPGLFLRGSSNTQVLVLLDGMRIGSATAGTTSIQDLMLDQIERIEVVRGNVSSLYGSEAIGGVIQIFTKQGKGDPKYHMNLGMGSLGTHRASTGISGANEKLDYALQVSQFKTDGVSAMNPALLPGANPDRDGYRNSSVSANIGYAFSAANRVAISLYDSSGKNQYDSEFATPTDVNRNRSDIGKFSFSSDNQLGEFWHSQLQFGQGSDNYRDYLNGLPNPYGSQIKSTQNQLSWLNTLQIKSAGQLLLGVEQLEQHVYSDLNPSYSPDQRRILSLLAGYTTGYGSHQWQVNLRQDRNSQYGNINTGLLGYGYLFDNSWRATTNVSTAFRAPTFNELYYPGYSFPDLRPEHSHNVEFAMHYTTAAHHLDISYFDNRTRDLILSDPISYSLSNIGKARTEGIEVSYAGQFGDTSVKSALTTQNPRNQTTGEILRGRARIHSNLTMNRQQGAWQYGAEWLYSSERQDAGHTLGSYSMLNLTAGYAINQKLRVSTRLDNLSNQNDSTAYGYNTPGRRIFINLNYQP